MKNFLIFLQKNQNTIFSNIHNHEIEEIKFLNGIAYGFFNNGNLKVNRNKKNITFFDDEFVSNINIFLDQENLIIKSDDFSSRSFFYYKTSELIIISESINNIIEILSKNETRLQLSPSALFQVIQSSYIYQANSSYITGINRIDSSTIMHINLFNFRSSFKKIITKSTKSKESFVNKDLDQASNSMKDQLISSLDKFKNKKIAIMQSAGLDSRLILLLCIKSGLRPDLITFGQSTVNNSDFYIASYLASKFKLNLIPFRIDANNIKNNEEFLTASNYSNLWQLAKLPKKFFNLISNYDYVIRGDGEGLYGWKDPSANLLDMLHRLEISPVESIFKYFKKYFKKNQELSIILYRKLSEIFIYGRHLENFKVYNSNYFYKVLRQEYLISSHISTLNKFTKIYNPLLEDSVLKEFENLKNKYKFNKNILKYLLRDLEREFSIKLKSEQIGPSWNNNLDNYISKINILFQENIKKEFNYSEDYCFKKEIKKNNFLLFLIKILKKFRYMRLIAIYTKQLKLRPSFTYDSGYRLYALAKLKSKLNN